MDSTDYTPGRVVCGPEAGRPLWQMAEEGLARYIAALGRAMGEATAERAGREGFTDDAGLVDGRGDFDCHR